MKSYSKTNLFARYTVPHKCYFCCKKLEKITEYNVIILLQNIYFLVTASLFVGIPKNLKHSF